jgi:prolyl-tRNA editing enzyme YbaK/EbsC (Cys-tRNA(Pro) deacylase)
VVRLSDEDDRFVLVPGDREIAWPKLRALLGVDRLSMPDADVALAVTGYVRGTISIGGGDHGVGLTVDAKALVKALDATVADVSD